MMTKEGSTKIVNCMIPGLGKLVLERDYISTKLKMHFFVKILVICKLNCTGVRDSCTRRGQISHVIKMQYFFCDKVKRGGGQ